MATRTVAAGLTFGFLKSTRCIRFEPQSDLKQSPAPNVIVLKRQEWDVFRKFAGKIGRLTWRHYSGMWFAEFPGFAEYAFLCGPLLYQLQYATEEEAAACKLKEQVQGLP